MIDGCSDGIFLVAEREGKYCYICPNCNHYDGFLSPQTGRKDKWHKYHHSVNYKYDGTEWILWGDEDWIERYGSNLIPPSAFRVTALF